MTSWQEPPLTRRQAREREARERQTQERQTQERQTQERQTQERQTQERQTPAARAEAAEPAAQQRRVTTTEATPAGQIPIVAEQGPASTPEPAARTKAPATKPDEHTLTRRQLRDMLQARAAAEVATQAIQEPLRGREPEAARKSAQPAESGTSFDDILSRNPGTSGSTTTSSALILPALPTMGNATAPFNSTGEILLTGSIDVPHGFTSLGRRPGRFESSDIDRLFDEEEIDPDTGNVAPVRATRAVSTHTSTRGTIAPQQSRWGGMPTVLMIIAVVLALGVAGLLISGYVLGIL